MMGVLGVLLKLVCVCVEHPNDAVEENNAKHSVPCAGDICG